MKIVQLHGKKLMYYKISLFLAIVVLTGGCAAVYYPNTHNVPLHKEEGELKLAAHSGLTGGSVQSSYATSNRLAWMANVSFRHLNDEGSAYRRHLFGEGAVGYHGRMGNFGVAEVYLGAGAGSGEAFGTYNLLGGTHDFDDRGQYIRVFGQANLGAEGKLGAAGIAIRPAYVQFYRFESDNHNQSRPGNLFIEPAFFARVGWDILKIEGQLGLSLRTGGSHNFDYVPFMMSLGMRLSLSELAGTGEQAP